MAENRQKLKPDGIGAGIRDSVKTFAEKIMAALGKNLKSITVVGSSLTEDFKPGQSDINTVLVLGQQDSASLKAISGMAGAMRKKRIATPLLMTSAYIERSRDVFGIEFLDFQLTHETIFGEDPFESLNFTKEDVRLQCERELKATLIRLRQGYIASSGNKRIVRDILISTAGSLVPLLRAMLWLKEVERPRRAEAVFKKAETTFYVTKAAVEFSIKVDSLIAVKRWRHEKVRLQKSEIEQTFESVYKAVDQLAVIVDKLEV